MAHRLTVDPLVASSVPLAAPHTDQRKRATTACGSLLLSQGKNLKQVQGWLRHFQLTTTLNAYIHETDDGLGGADVWDGVLGATWGHPGATAGPGTAEVRKSPLLAETADLQAKP